MFIFISGSSESGKSLFAEKRLSEFESEKKFYVATAKISDLEMRERVQKHKLMRKDKNFITTECEKNLGKLKFPANSSVLIESLTTWLANEMFEGGNVEKIFDDFLKISSQCKNIILVSDYIFSDGAIYDEATEKYIKTLAELSIKFADEADEVFECFAGLEIKYKSYSE